jgi:hypothetical protein
LLARRLAGWPAQLTGAHGYFGSNCVSLMDVMSTDERYCMAVA